MKRRTAVVIVVLVLLSLAAGAAYAQVGGSFDLSWSTIDGGGGTFSTGGSYSAGGTIGQPDAGSLSAGQFTLDGGFWGAAASTPTPTPTSTSTSTAVSTATRTVTPTSTASTTNIPSNTPTRTASPSGTPTSTFTNTPTNTATNTPTVTAQVPTNTPIPAPSYSPTATSTGTRTATPTGTSTSTPPSAASATATSTPTPFYTGTPTNTPTALAATGTTTQAPTTMPTLTATATQTPSSGPTATATATATNTAVNTPTMTNTPTLTCTPTVAPTSTMPASTPTLSPSMTPTLTSTPTPILTATPTTTPTTTPTGCSLSFEDVSPTDWYYQYVQYMYCHEIVSGYNTSPPCSQPGVSCFKPYNNTTRGQLTKIVVRSFAFPINTQGGPHFSDVSAGSAFYDYVETGYNMGLWGGYPDGTFRPSDSVTRGQITKMVVNAAIQADPAHWTLENPPTNTFEDVEVGSTFFRYIETAVSHGVVNGYHCGAAPAGPCVPPLNRPYFVPGANATRAQISKITYLAVTYTFR